MNWIAIVCLGLCFSCSKGEDGQSLADRNNKEAIKRLKLGQKFVLDLEASVDLSAKAQLPSSFADANPKEVSEPIAKLLSVYQELFPKSEERPFLEILKDGEAIFYFQNTEADFPKHCTINLNASIITPFNLPPPMPHSMLTYAQKYNDKKKQIEWVQNQTHVQLKDEIEIRKISLLLNKYIKKGILLYAYVFKSDNSF
jgi:hypothetical protein